MGINPNSKKEIFYLLGICKGSVLQAPDREQIGENRERFSTLTSWLQNYLGSFKKMICLGPTPELEISKSEAQACDLNVS